MFPKIVAIKDPILENKKGYGGGTVNSIALTPDKKYIVAGFGSPKNAIGVYNIETGECLWETEEQKSQILGVAVTPDMTRIISDAYHDPSTMVWDFKTGERIWTSEKALGGANSILITKSGTHAITDYGLDIKMWDLETGKCVRTFKGYPGSSSQMKFYLQKLRTKGHHASVNSIALTPDESRLISGSDDSTVKIWDFKTGKCLRTLFFQGELFFKWNETHTEKWKYPESKVDGYRADPYYNIEGFVLMVDLYELRNVTYKPILKTYETSEVTLLAREGEAIIEWNGHLKAVTSVVVTPDGKQIISGSEDGTAQVWDLATGQCQHVFLVDSTGINHILGLSPDGTRLFSFAYGAWVWDLQTKELEVAFKTIATACSVINRNQVVTGHCDGTILKWTLVEG